MYAFVVKNETYNLQLTTRSIINIETKIKQPFMGLFMASVSPNLEDEIFILKEAMQKYHHGTTFEKACDIMDDWLSDGHTIIEFADVIVNLCVDSGVFAKPEETEDEKAEKNL